MIVARREADAKIVARRALRYADGSGHVRAASGLAWQKRGAERVLVAPQDDTSFLAVFRPPDGDVSRVAIDYAPGGVRVFEERAGTKALKLDLESIAAVGDRRALAFGSGSHANRRRIAVIEDFAVRLVDCTALYEALAARTDFAGSELNVEGAACIGDRFFLANRGNGAARGGLGPVDAIATLSRDALLAHVDGGPVPAIVEVRRFDLGTIDGGRLTFTDLAPGPDGDLFFLAAAEKSPNAYDDGEVVGAAIGRIREDDAVLAILVDDTGSVAAIKPEGLAIETDRLAYACVDADDPDVPSDLVTLAPTFG